MNTHDMERLLTRMSAEESRIIAQNDYRQSAVIILLIPPEDPHDRLDEWSILFEKRAAHIPQGGESCLPGGGIEPGEPSAVAACRELAEETGIGDEQLGCRMFYGSLVNPGGSLLFCHMGIWNKSAPLKPNEEVEKLFQVKLGRLHRCPISEYQVGIRFDGENVKRPIPFSNYALATPYAKNWRGADMKVLFYEDLDHVIWGMTAKIVRDFVEELYTKAELMGMA